MARSDDIGARAEWLRLALLTDLYGRGEPFFRARPLGDKCPTFDILVELVVAGRMTPFFFVQVKGTTQGYTKTRPPRLKVSVSGEDVERMAACPAPTYLIGIDNRTREGYVLAVYEGMTGPSSSLPITYPLNRRNLGLLWKEVKEFWDKRDMARNHSLFSLEGQENG